MIEIQDFGACLLSAVEKLLVQHRVTNTWHQFGINGPSIYTLDEAIQAAEWSLPRCLPLRRRSTLPPVRWRSQAVRATLGEAAE